VNETPLIPPTSVAHARSHGFLPIAFGPRFFVGLLLGFGWLAPAWWMPRLVVAMFVWDALILAAWIWDLARLPRPSQLEVRRVWNARPLLAVPGKITVEIRNLSPTFVRLQVVDESSPQLRLVPASLEITARGNGVGRAEYPILASSRGDTRLGQIFLRYRTMLQLAERWGVAAVAQTVCVLPNLDEAKKHTLYLIRSRQVEMEKRRRRQRGMGREFDSLREYREGDEVRDISWTATARRNHLVTRIFETERSQIVWIVLDAGRLLRSQLAAPGQTLRLSKLDYAVNAALSLAQVAMHCGDRVGLLAYGRQVQQNLNAGRGPQQTRAIVEALARVRGESGEADHGRAAHSLLSTQKRRSLIIWITDFAETATTPEVIEYAAHMTTRHLVLFAAMAQQDLAAVASTTPAATDEMYRHVAALEIAHRRDVLLRGLRQRGVLAMELTPGILASALVNQYLDVKDRSLL
jgi:uncharacterized protein (DUF58 family)